MENRIEKVLKKFGKPYKKEGDCIVLSVQITTLENSYYVNDITIKVLDEELGICSVIEKCRDKDYIKAQTGLKTIDNVVDFILEYSDDICI